MGRLCDKNQEIKIPYPHLNVFMCVDMLFLFLFLVILTHVSGPITPLIHQSGGGGLCHLFLRSTLDLLLSITTGIRVWKNVYQTKPQKTILRETISQICCWNLFSKLGNWKQTSFPGQIGTPYHGLVYIFIAL